MASAIEMPCFFKPLWVSERKNHMIATLNRTHLAALALIFFVSPSWSLLAGPQAGRRITAESTSAAPSDSNMNLSGEELWSNNCLRCHNIRPPTMYSNAQWDVIVHHMRIRANITGQEQRAIVEFLKSAK